LLRRARGHRGKKRGGKPKGKKGGEPSDDDLRSETKGEGGGEGQGAIALYWLMVDDRQRRYGEGKKTFALDFLTSRESRLRRENRK